YETEYCKKRELLPQRFAVSPRVHKTQTQSDPDEGMQKVVEPGQEAHYPNAVEDVVAHKHTHRPAKKEHPECLSKIELNLGICVPHHQEKSSVHSKHPEII